MSDVRNGGTGTNAATIYVSTLDRSYREPLYVQFSDSVEESVFE